MYRLFILCFTILSVTAFGQSREYYCGTTVDGNAGENGGGSEVILCSEPNVFVDFGNEYYIPDESSPILTVNINIHVPWHPWWEANGKPNFQEDNPIHITYLKNIIKDAEAKIFNDPGSEELCFWNVTTAPLMIDSKIRLNLKDIHFHEDSLGVTNNNDWCGSYLYNTYVANDPERFNALNIFFTYGNTTSGGCGQGLNGESTNYAIVPNDYPDFLQDSAFWSQGPNVAHEISHCLGLHHTCESSQQTLFEFECIVTCPEYDTLLPYDHGVNHNMVPGGSVQKYSSPLQFAHMRRLLLTGWRSKLLDEYPETVETIRITQPTVWEDNITWYGDIKIEAGGSLTLLGSTLLMSEQRRIFVKRGAKLIIDGGQIASCGNIKWQGIIVEGAAKLSGQLDDPFGPTSNQYAGTVIMINGANIDNASNGISTYNHHYGYPAKNSFHGGLIYCDSASFTQCDRAVELTRFGTPDRLDESVFNKVDFNGLGSGVSVWASDGVTFTHCQFVDIERAAIHSWNAAINVWDGNIFNDVWRGVDLVGTKINEASSVIGLDGTEANRFQSGEYGLYLSTVNNLLPVTITNNDFETTTGVYVDGPSQFFCHHNDFDGCTEGVHALDTDININLVNNNDFIANHVAIRARHNNSKLTFTNNCMDGTLSKDVWVYGISGDPGIVNLEQGSEDIPSGNCFTKGAIPEISTKGVSQTFDYYVDTSLISTSSCFNPEVLGTFSVEQSGSQPTTECGRGFSGVPPTEASCVPAANETTLLLEIADLDADIAQLKTNGGSLSAIHSKERCLRLSLLSLASMYASNKDYTSSNSYFAGRTEYDLRLIPFANHIQNEDWQQARIYLNGLQTNSSRQADHKSVQYLYLDYLESAHYALNAIDSLFLVNTGSQVGPLNAHARSVYYAITGNTLEIPLPVEERALPPKKESVEREFETFRVYPNPLISNLLNIKGPDDIANVDISIRDVQGQLVYKAVDFNVNQSIQLHSLPSGIYWLSIRSPSDTLHQEKLVILE